MDHVNYNYKEWKYIKILYCDIRDLDSLEVTDQLKSGFTLLNHGFSLDKHGVLKAKFEGFISKNDLINELNQLENF